MQERDVPIESGSGFLQVLHRELENPQYPFALRWKNGDGSFVFQTAAGLERKALERLGFEDKTGLFYELFRWGFEQVISDSTDTQDGSPARPVFRHPSGHFGPGSISYLHRIAPYLTRARVEARPLEPFPIPQPTSSGSYRTTFQLPNHQVPIPPSQRRPVFNRAVSSPMIRSPGLSNSSFSMTDSTRSWSPISPPTQFYSPPLDNYTWHGSTSLEGTTQGESSVKEGSWMSDLTEGAIKGLANLSLVCENRPFDDPTPVTSSPGPSKYPVFPQVPLPSPRFDYEPVLAESSPRTERGGGGRPTPQQTPSPRYPHSSTSLSQATPVAAKPTSGSRKKSKSSKPRSSRPSHSQASSSTSPSFSPAPIHSRSPPVTFRSQTSSNRPLSQSVRASTVYHPYLLSTAPNVSIPRTLPHQSLEVWNGSRLSTSSAHHNPIPPFYPFTANVSNPNLLSSPTTTLYPHLHDPYLVDSFLPQTRRPTSFVRRTPREESPSR